MCPSIWKIYEHLLLGAHCFPLLVKQQLKAAEHYTLTKQDQVGIEAFERLAGHANLFKEMGRGIWPWREIVGNMMFELGLR